MDVSGINLAEMLCICRLFAQPRLNRRLDSAQREQVQGA
jgi:hypothetical protein